jgi:hypothetical protein
LGILGRAASVRGHVSVKSVWSRTQMVGGNGTMLVCTPSHGHSMAVAKSKFFGIN